ncbi:MAG TPA: hypothetical protein VGL94_03845 [Ktedonobacteraceae bacterium]|jgi:hypothetical protein
MLAFANSYTSGALNTQFSGSVVATAGPKTHAATPKPTLTSGTLPESWIQRALDQLDDIAKLGPDWDSYGADPPSSLAITIASELLLIVNQKFGKLAYEESQPQIVAPRPDGGIQIEWGTRPVEIAVHANPSGSLGYLYINRQGDISEYKEVSSASWSEVLQLIAKVVFTVSR